MALRKLLAKRGYSDTGTNFTGSSSALNELDYKRYFNLQNSEVFHNRENQMKIQLIVFILMRRLLGAPYPNGERIKKNFRYQRGIWFKERLAFTTPRPVGESSTDDSAPPHHTSFELGGSGYRAMGRHSRVCPRTAQITEDIEFLPSVADLHSTVVKRSGYHSVRSHRHCHSSSQSLSTNSVALILISLSRFTDFAETLAKRALSAVIFRALSGLIINVLSFLRLNYLDFSEVIRKI
ncbi:hypothetical protein NPIL_463201 [Nephila pilipes]|uniref:Uncharacterized protein n=1 Tax=Nephila pilipes TaxID=299642 RepID=A0A8X6NQL1_NEPPI|nr:hypothetical protein NPIL_463201 [Nephila pilipes]